MNKELIIFLKELLQASDKKDKCDICIKNKTLKEILNYIDNSISKEIIKDKVEEAIELIESEQFKIIMGDTTKCSRIKYILASLLDTKERR